MDKLDSVLQSLSEDGYAVVRSVLPPRMCADLRSAMDKVADAIERDIGRLRLQRAGENGVLRCMFCYDPIFYSLLELWVVDEIVNSVLASSAILHLQNGFITKPGTRGEFQNQFHRDFPRVLGSVVSVNLFFMLTDFTEENGATRVIPRSHQGGDTRTAPVPILGKAGDLLAFDSTLWHAAGENHSTEARYAINHQYTHHWIKSQINYFLATGDRMPTGSRARQRLGYEAITPANIEQYYAEPRLYKGGQG